MLRLKNKVVVVTGASAGIGRCLALEFAEKGAAIVIAARSIQKLKELENTLKSKNADVFPVLLDITSRSSIKSMVDKVIGKYGRIDILVNNAAIGHFDNAADSKWDDINRLFETNFFGPLYCIQLAISHMRKRKSGLIVNISSAVSKYSLYHQGIYSATKSALERITEALSAEESGNGIKTLLVIPDRTKTQIRSNSLGNKRFSKLPFNLPESPPSSVAKKIIKSIINENAVCHTSVRSKIYSMAAAMAPKTISRLVKRSHNKFMKEELL